MFTGLVTAIGRIADTALREGGLDLTIAGPYTDLTLGESVAVDGACLTVVAQGTAWFRVHVVRTSLERTLFSDYAAGRGVNLERALQVGDRLGGHLVQGHVDGIGTVARMETRDDARVLDLLMPAELTAVSMPLGSITVDGVSLTVHAVAPSGTVQVSLIPHTLEHTTLRDRKVGDRVHLESDIIGKYVAHLMKGLGALSPES